MFCAITLGIGIDYAVHLVAAHDRARRAGADRPTHAALAASGPAIVSDAAAIGLGFGLLALSRVPANARLGLLVALALGTACAFTLLGLGATLAAPRRRAGDQAAAAPALPRTRRSSSSSSTPALK
jgi:predicted RND superfamily exporter protein